MINKIQQTSPDRLIKNGYRAQSTGNYKYRFKGNVDRNAVFMM